MCWIGDIDDAQAAIYILAANEHSSLGDVGVTSRHRHIRGIPRRVVEADLEGSRRVGNVDDAQAAPSSGDVGVVSRYRNAHYNVR